MHQFLNIKGLGDEMLKQVFTHGGVALFTIFLIEEAGIPMPLPGDLILLYAGVLLSQKILTLPVILTYSVLGVACGSTILFLIFDKGGRSFAYKYGKYILLPHKRIKKLENFFKKYGKEAVLVGRFLPGLRVFVSAIAGLAGTLSYSSFLLQVVVASSAWILLFVGLGYFLGKEFVGIVAKIESFGYFLFIAFFAFIIYEFWRNAKEERRISSSTH